MFWDDDDLEAARYVKRTPASKPLHRSEAISVFGSTDVLHDTPDAQPPEMHSKLAEHQAAIPRLPVPELHETCELYLKSLEGLVNAEDYMRVKAQVDEFEQSGGVGETLQQLLLKHATEATGPSWLEEFWDDAYLCTRDPIPINVNYFFGFDRHPQHAEYGSQLSRAAGLVHAAARFAVMTRQQSLSLDTERGQPLCMSQYRRVFSASRVPQRNRDKIVTYTTTALLDDEKVSRTTEYVARSPRHIVVLIRNRFYSIDVLHENGTDVLSIETIARRIAFAMHHATDKSQPSGVPIGLFTTLSRDDWADLRAHLVSLGNEATLESIQSAIIMLVLDGLIVDGTDELSRVLLHGSGTNRWFDRHNLIVTANGEAGINFEHSVGDGITTLRVADFMYRANCSDSMLHRDAAQQIQNEVASALAAKKSTEGSLVKELTWCVDDVVDRQLKAAYECFTQLIQSNETATLQFRHFGGDLIKKAGLSPDAFVQVAFQLTHYRLFGRCEATYEAASTRCFLHGRTEVVRSATRASTDFCEAAHLPVFTRRINSKVPSQVQLLRDACAAHVEYMKRAKAGRGVDRHMLGLRLMAVRHGIPIPAIFADHCFQRSSHWNLSTSHCGSSALCLFGFGPVVADGFGLGYMIKNDNISCCVTSKYTHRLSSSNIFASMLESSLLQMKSIVECDWEKRRKERPKSLEFVHPTAYADFTYHEASGFTYQHPRRSLYKTTVKPESVPDVFAEAR